MPRIELTGNTSFYADWASGNDANDGLTPATAVKNPQVLRTRLEFDYDLRGFGAQIKLAPGAYASGIQCNGPLVGQRSPGQFQIVGDPTFANIATTVLQPTTAGHSCISLAWGATAQVFGFQVDGTYSAQDLIMVGQQSTLMIGDASAPSGSAPPQMLFGKCANPYNHLTLSMGAAGLQVMNNYKIWSQGISPQCHIDADDAWVYFNTNGVPGLITVTVQDATSYYDSFIHCSQANLNIQRVGWNCVGGALAGTKTCIVEKSGVIDTGTSGNPNAFPGTIAPVVRTNGIYL